MTSIVSSAPRFAVKHRAAVVLMCAIAVFVAYADRVNISVAALAMQRDLGWTDSQKGLVLASFFIGFVATQVVGGWMSHRYGGERVLIWSLVFWSICTILTPPFAHASFALLLVIRIGLGLGEGPLSPSIFNLFARYVPPHEHARAIGVFAGSGHAGTIVALLSTGYLVNRYGWDWAFYLFGLAGLLYAFVLWRLLGPTSPVELVPVAEDASRTTDAIPWGKLLRLRPFIGLALSFFCSCWVFYVLLLWMPSYFARVHGMRFEVTGIYSLAPWLVLIVVQNLAGWVSDFLLGRGVSRTLIRKCCVVAGLIGAGALLATLPGASSVQDALLRFVLVTAFLAVAFIGQLPNVFDIAPRYAGVVFSLLNTFGSLPGLVGVALTGWLVQTTGSFDSTLVLASGLAAAGALVFLVFGSGQQKL